MELVNNSYFCITNYTSYYLLYLEMYKILQNLKEVSIKMNLSHSIYLQRFETHEKIIRYTYLIRYVKYIYIMLNEYTFHQNSRISAENKYCYLLKMIKTHFTKLLFYTNFLFYHFIRLKVWF